VVLLFALTPNICAQDAETKRFVVISKNTYQDLLNAAFPTGEWDPRLLYRITILIQPSSAPESKIVINRKSDTTQVLEYMAMNGNIYAQANAYKKRHGLEDFQKMLSMIRVQKRSLEMPSSETDVWHKQLFEQFEQALLDVKRTTEKSMIQHTADVVIDGTTYDVMYEAGTNAVSFSVYDAEIHSTEVTGEMGFVRWINRLRLAIAKRK